MKRFYHLVFILFIAFAVNSAFRQPPTMLDDIDDDNDGITDMIENGGYEAFEDDDNDGIVNYKDKTPNCPTPIGLNIYGKPYDPLVWSDCNGDGINDFFDWDRDGVMNEMDLDSDNDGILDIQEARDTKAKDLDKNGMVDGIDNDGDGLMSSADANDNNPSPAASMGLIPQDLDRDGRPNYLDLDSDGDGIVDNREALQLDAFASGYNGLTSGVLDDDGDGVRTINYTNNYNDADNFHGFGAKGIVLLDNDGDGYPNAYDIDSDNDGITDNVEGQPTCSYAEPLGLDVDGDGLDDAYDFDKNICTRKAAGITPYDKEYDGTPDIRDLDTDNDGAPDVNEGSGLYSDFVTDFGDADGDGLIDQFDIFKINNATTQFTHNVCHNEMGNGGTRNGPVPSGSTATLPQMKIGECPMVDRDWRDVSILPLSLTNFKGVLANKTVKLIWTIENEESMNYYVVERSNNGKEYKDITKITAKGNSSTSVTYTYDDNDVNTSGVFYYRLREYAKTGKWKISKVVTIKVNEKTGTGMSLFPNPAKSSFNILFNAQKTGMVTIKMMEMSGKVMLMQNKRVLVGENVLSIQNKGSVQPGLYNVQLLSDDGLLFNQLMLISK